MLKHVETCWNQLAMMRFLAVCCGSSTFPSILDSIQRSGRFSEPSRHRSLSLWKFNLSSASPAKPTGCFNQGVKNGWWVDFFPWCLPWLPRSSLDSRWYAQSWGTENLGSRRRAPNFPCETSKGDRLCPCTNAAWPGKFQAVYKSRAIPSVTSRQVASGRSKALAVRSSVVHSWSKLECCHCNAMRRWVSMDHYMKIVDTHQSESCWWIKKNEVPWSATGFLINGGKLYGFHCFPLFSLIYW